MFMVFDFFATCPLMMCSWVVGQTLETPARPRPVSARVGRCHIVWVVPPSTTKISPLA